MGSIGECCQTVGNSIDSCFSCVGSQLSSFSSFVSNNCSTVGNGISSGCSAIGNGISSCCNSFTTCITSFATDTVWSCLQSVWSAASGFFKACGNLISKHKEFSFGAGAGCLVGIVFTSIAAWFSCNNENSSSESQSFDENTQEGSSQKGQSPIKNPSMLANPLNMPQGVSDATTQEDA